MSQQRSAAAVCWSTKVFAICSLILAVTSRYFVTKSKTGEAPRPFVDGIPACWTIDWAAVLISDGDFSSEVPAALDIFRFLSGQSFRIWPGFLYQKHAPFFVRSSRSCYVSLVNQEVEGVGFLFLLNLWLGLKEEFEDGVNGGLFRQRVPSPAGYYKLSK